MRARGISIAVALALAFAFAGCTEPPGVRVEEVCDALCTCNAQLTADPTQCASTCESQLGAIAIADSCLDCLDEPLCSTRTSCLLACLPLQGTP